MNSPISVIRRPDGWVHPYDLELPQNLRLGTTEVPCRRCGLAMINRRHRFADTEQSIAFVVPSIAGAAVGAIERTEVLRQSPQRTCARMVEALREVTGRA